MKTFLNILMLLIPFIDFIYDIHFKNYPDLRFVYFIYLVYFLTYIKNFITISFFKEVYTEFRLLLLAIIGIVILSLYNIYVDNTTPNLFLKQFIVVSFISFTSFMFIYNNRNNLNYIMDLYLKISFIFACISIFQEIFYVINFEYLYDFSYLMLRSQQIGGYGFFIRAPSFCLEPPMFAFALIFAAFISLHSLITGYYKYLSKTKSLIIITAMLCTYSTIGYVSLFLSIIFIVLYNFKNVKLKNLTIILFLTFFIFSLGGNTIVSKIKDVITLQQNDISKYTFDKVSRDEKKRRKINIQKDENNVNISSYLLMAHFKRTIDDFCENPIIGKGLGSYTYTKNSIKLKKYVFAKFPDWIPFRLDGSTSLIFKITVEFGFIGIIMLFVILYKYYIFDFKYMNKFNNFIVINNAMLIYIIFILIRMPFYFTNGLWIFVWLYVFSKQQFLHFTREINVTE